MRRKDIVRKMISILVMIFLVMGLVSCSESNDSKEISDEAVNDVEIIETEQAEIQETSIYELEEVNYPEEAKLDLKLKKVESNNVLWEKTWTDIYLTELDPYSVLVNKHDRLYVVVQGMLNVIDYNGNAVFDPIRVGSCEVPYVDGEGNIYCTGYYGPFATKVSPNGDVIWSTDGPIDSMWPWHLSINGDYLYVDCEQMNGTGYDTVQLNKETGEIGNLYWIDVDGIIFEKIKASSTLENYSVGNLIDGLKETGWVEGSADYGLGESISFEHSSPVKLSKIVIQNGYQKSQELFNKNGRVRRVDIEFSSGEIHHHEFENTMEPITIMLENPVETTSVTLTIQAVYPGSLYEDTVISGIQFY